ncbi:hypothetical protein LCGC14_1157740 [marine sediment metagenome]|uniref:Uncharacterized protein n=1 Tax=marine sediment metagenome TaxID=412755 RepID=A0A0F9LYM2_9ZZZZ
MLENLPVVSPEAVEAVKARLNLPDHQEVDAVLAEARKSNPHLVAWLVKAVDVPLELAFGEDPDCEELVTLLRPSLLWGMVLTLGLVDRALFAHKIAQATAGR